jgi:molybdate transport system substrate-binding protein
MMRRSWIIAAAVPGLVVAGCRSGPREQRLVVFAAASLSDPFTVLADSLKARHPGLKIDFSFSGSQTLALQLSQRASADVFASADERYIKIVGDSGLLAAPPSAFANNSLVVIVPANNPAGIQRLQDLARAKVKLVLAGEAVPAGHYAREVIGNLGKLSGYPTDFERRVLANLVSNEESVKGVVTKVELGEADAGLVYSSDVTPKLSSKVMRIEIPREQNIKATYLIGQLRAAPNAALAREFIELVLSNVGQQVLVAAGFLSPSV